MVNNSANYVSIIVPVYNAEKYLHRCIDSILSQTFPDFELLLVDDGSSDRSGVICDEYSTKDFRVRVFHKENGGVSSARNLGLDRAQGEWITFIDADDWVDEVFLSKLYVEKINDIDLVVSYAKYINRYGIVHEKKYATRTIDAKDVQIMFIDNDLAWQTSPWAKLYRKDICKHIRFIEGMHIGEDLVFLYSYIMRCGQIYILGENYYNYDIGGNNTLTKSIGKLDVELYAYNNIFSLLNTFIESKSIINEEALKKINWIKSYYIHRVLNSLYHTTGLSAKDRCSMICNLDIDIYTAYSEFSSIKEIILQYILKHKWYKIYDLMRIWVSKIKRR